MLRRNCWTNPFCRGSDLGRHEASSSNRHQSAVQIYPSRSECRKGNAPGCKGYSRMGSGEWRAVLLPDARFVLTVLSLGRRVRSIAPFSLESLVNHANLRQALHQSRSPFKLRMAMRYSLLRKLCLGLHSPNSSSHLASLVPHLQSSTSAWRALEVHTYLRQMISTWQLPIEMREGV